ncbi:hypothetical protein AAXE64_27155 [Priestia megaterium]|uniref:hypothetical protein n=1 Tax=Priestia megaterium TaxID=1404 RepID=UPI003CFBD0F4
MIKKKSWEEFRESGIFWLMNGILHTFGWAIVLNYNKETNECIGAYPARVKFRGFSEDINTEGYKKVSTYLKENIDELHKEANE